MSSPDAILHSVTPEFLESIIRQIASQTGHDTIAAGLIADRIIAQHGLEPGIDRSQVYVQLVHEIAKKVATMKGMRFIEND